MSEQKYVAPDGGWGWVIVFAFALNNIAIIPIIQNFGMIYGSAFQRFGVSATEATLIINVNQAFGMVLGMMNGPLLHKYGYRKMAIAGSVLYSSGIILTSFGSSLMHFIITYGMLTSLGISMGFSSFSLAINTYFKEKRGRAMGWAMTITGIGPIVMPHLASVLLLEYGNERTMFLLGGMSLNSIVGALLLHPIKWHAKPVKKTTGEENEKDDGDDSKKKIASGESISLLRGSKKSLYDVENGKAGSWRRSRAALAADVSDDNANIYGFEMPVSIHNGSLMDIRDIGTEQEFESSRRKEFKRSISFNETKARKFNTGSRYGDLGVPKKVLADCPEEEGESARTGDGDAKKERHESPVPSASFEEETPKRAAADSQLKRAFLAVNKFFDLDLLRDPVYVNIMLGMSLAIFAEFNFSTLTPFILKDMQLSDADIATVMSALATTDLLLRAVAPYIGEFLHKSPRIMYLISLFLLIVTRSGLLVAENFYLIIVVAFGLGVAKGVRTVYMTLVIPSHVPLEKLANASSIQSLVNGFFLMVAGPCLGLIRDLTGSYLYCIVLINCVTAITIVLWLGEFAIGRIRRESRSKPRSNQIEINH